MSQKLKTTPLNKIHRKLGARMVEFAGWEMPVQYRGVIEEHLAVRSRAGLFDVSHMGEIEIRGSDALAVCQRVTANDVSRVKVSQAQYNLLLNEKGGVVDDLVIYRLGEAHLLLCVNAANIEKDLQWIVSHAEGNVEIKDVSTSYALLALQGPVAAEVLQASTPTQLVSLKPFCFFFGEVCGIHCLVSRTGYTGEDGFELYCDFTDSVRLWNLILEVGREFGLSPAGLGARDTLRLEKGYPLYGHELDNVTTPLEAGLSWMVKFSKGEFLGRMALEKQKREGIRHKLVGLEMLAPGIARGGYSIYKNEIKIGQVTSGTMSPTLKKAVAMGYVTNGEAYLENFVEVEIRGRKVDARIRTLPFYSPVRKIGDESMGISVQTGSQ